MGSLNAPHLTINYKQSQTIMARKTYHSGFKRDCFFFNIDGKSVSVIFLGGREQGSTYITSDKRIQDAIESLQTFKDGCIKLISTEDEENKPQSEETTEPVEANNTPETTKEQKIQIKTWQEGKTYLVKEYGVAPTKLKNSEAIKNEAKALGITFCIAR